MNDSFGRLKTSTPNTYFEYCPSEISQSNGCDRDVWINSITENGTVLYAKNNTILLTCNENNSNVKRKSRTLIGNSLGKSRSLYFSGILLSREISENENVTVTVGLHSVRNTVPVNGYYLKTNGKDLYLCRASNELEIAISQSNWNIDQFDGSGPSKKCISSSSITKVYCLVIDEDWICTGKVRMGFNINGINYFAHQFVVEDLSSLIIGKLPITYNIVTNTIFSPLSSVQLFSCVTIDGNYTRYMRRVSFHTCNFITIRNYNKKYILCGTKLSEIYKNSNARLLFCNVASKILPKFPIFVEIQLHSIIGNVGGIEGQLQYKNIKESVSTFAEGNGTQTITSDGYMLSSKIMTNNFVTFDLYEIKNEIVRFDLNYSDSLYIVICQIEENDPIDFICSIDIGEY